MSVERIAESGKFKICWVILGEKMPISVELELVCIPYMERHPIPVDIITQNCLRNQRILYELILYVSNVSYSIKADVTN